LARQAGVRTQTGERAGKRVSKIDISNTYPPPPLCPLPRGEGK